MFDGIIIPHGFFDCDTLPPLKPCPFCKIKPMMKKTKRWPNAAKYKGESIDAYTVVCVNIRCLIYDADNQYYLNKYKAFKAWQKCGD